MTPAVVSLSSGESLFEPGWYVWLNEDDEPQCVAVHLTDAGHLTCEIPNWWGGSRYVPASDLTFIARIYPDRIEGREG